MNLRHLQFNSEELLKNLKKFNKIIEKFENELVCESLSKLKIVNEKIAEFAFDYDFDEIKSGNGFWSFVYVSLKALDFVDIGLKERRRNLR